MYDRNITINSSLEGVFAVVEKRDGYRPEVHYVLKDNLGSWTTITYAWGNRRNASTWSGTAIDTPLFDRGFTGHEHLYNFGLINMNGRVYDPLMSSFLSPDNFIQCPDNSQNFNRYAYCLNNPLRYTDPSGEFCWHIVIGVLIGGTANLVANWDNCSGFWEYAAAFGAGAGAGAAVAATGGMGFVAGAGIAAADGFNITSPVAKGMIGGAIGGAAGGYAGGFVGGYIMTGDLEEAHNAGLNGMWQGAVMGGISGGIGGYVAAKSEGINPWTGIHNKSVVLGESMANRVIPAAKDMQAEYLDAPQMEDAYFGHEISPNTTYTNKTSMEYNAQWIEGKMGQGYHLYDIGPAGSKVTSPYYNMEQCRTISYQYLHNCHYNSIKIYNFQIRLITWK